MRKADRQLNQYPQTASIDMHMVEAVVRRIFHPASPRLERVAEGVSTYVYRILSDHQTFYLRILPEEGNSFAPEVAAHTQLSQMGVKVPTVISFEHRNDLLRLSIMLITEVKGSPLSASPSLSLADQKAVVRAAGRDLALLNSITVAGFGWVERDQTNEESLRAQWPTHRAFTLEFWEADLAYLAATVLPAPDVAALERILSRNDPWLDVPQAQLAHGDFDTTHIYHHEGHYTGMIDFGEIRGANRWYDLAHFHIRDGEHLPYRLLPTLLEGYHEVSPLPTNHEEHLRFTSLFINIRALSRALQKRPPNRYTQHQLERLREDIAALL